jgi:chromosome segregation ATPase
LQTALKDIVNWEEELERGAVEMKSLDGAIEEADKNVEAQKKITSAWKMKEEELWTELGRRKQYSEAVREEICNQQNFQEEALESQRSELRACVRSLHCSRQNNDLLQHKRDKLTQELHAVEQKKKDAAREEVRYSEETSRVDQQLEVAMGQYTLVKQDHLSLAQSLRAKQEQVRDSDLHWKATLEGIEEQRREEVKIRTVFESKLSFDQDDMEKLLKEQMKKKSRVSVHLMAVYYSKKQCHCFQANRILEEWNKKTSIQKTITGVAESDHQKWLTTVEDVENKLRSLSEELLKVEKEFDNFKTNLLSRLQAAKLTYSQAQRDIQELEATTSQLRDSIEDVGRCLAVLVHSVDKADLRLESLAQENKDLDKHSRVALDDVAKLSQLKMDFDSL